MREAILLPLVGVTVSTQAAIDPRNVPYPGFGGLTCVQIVEMFGTLFPMEEQRGAFPYRQLFIDLSGPDVPVVETARVTHPAFAELPSDSRAFLHFIFTLALPNLLVPLEEVADFRNLPPYSRGTLDETQRKLSEKERGTAELLLAEGWNLTATPEGIVQNQRCAEGVSSQPLYNALNESAISLDPKVEFKNLESAESRAVVDRVVKSLHGGGQAPFIILDARDCGMPAEEALRGIGRLRGVLLSRQDLRERGYHERLHRLRVVGQGYEWDAHFVTRSARLKVAEALLDAFRSPGL